MSPIYQTIRGAVDAIPATLRIINRPGAKDPDTYDADAREDAKVLAYMLSQTLPCSTYDELVKLLLRVPLHERTPCNLKE